MRLFAVTQVQKSVRQPLTVSEEEPRSPSCSGRKSAVVPICVDASRLSRIITKVDGVNVA